MLKAGLPLVGLAAIAAVANGTNVQQQQQQQQQQQRSLAEIVPYALKMIQADELGLGENAPLICIVDSGIDLDHPEFDPSSISGKDNDNRFWMDPMPWDVDFSGHGTRIAGIVAAIGGNDIGIQGAGAFPLFVTRGVDDEGKAYPSDVQKAVEQCVDAGSKIVLLGLGSNQNTMQLDFYNQVVNDQGVMVIGAAGNNGEEYPNWPARYASVIAVGGVDEAGQLWENTAKNVEFVGPAADIPSITPIVDTTAGDTTSQTGENLEIQVDSGTGVAAAYFAAAAGLVWSHYPDCTNEDIRMALARTAFNANEAPISTATARTASNPTDVDLGHGVPQTYDAFKAIQIHGCDLSAIPDEQLHIVPTLDIPSVDTSESEDESDEDTSVNGARGTDDEDSEDDKRLSTGAIGGIVVGIAAVLFFCFMLLICGKRDNNNNNNNANSDPIKDDETVDEEAAAAPESPTTTTTKVLAQEDGKVIVEKTVPQGDGSSKVERTTYPDKATAKAAGFDTDQVVDA